MIPSNHGWTTYHFLLGLGRSRHRLLSFYFVGTRRASLNSIGPRLSACLWSSSLRNMDIGSLIERRDHWQDASGLRGRSRSCGMSIYSGARKCLRLSDAVGRRPRMVVLWKKDGDFLRINQRTFGKRGPWRKLYMKPNHYWWDGRKNRRSSRSRQHSYEYGKIELQKKYPWVCVRVNNSTDRRGRGIWT